MDPNEENEKEVSTSRKATVLGITLAVTVVVGMAATALTEKINKRIREKMIPEDEQ